MESTGCVTIMYSFVFGEKIPRQPILLLSRLTCSIGSTYTGRCFSLCMTKKRTGSFQRCRCKAAFMSKTPVETHLAAGVNWWVLKRLHHSEQMLKTHLSPKVLFP